MEIIAFFSGLVIALFTQTFKNIILQPLLKRAGQDVFNHVIKEVYEDFDIKWLPENYNKGLSAAYNYLVETCIPQKDENLKPEEIEKIAQIVLTNFNIINSLKKLND